MLVSPSSTRSCTPPPARPRKPPRMRAVPTATAPSHSAKCDTRMPSPRATHPGLGRGPRARGSRDRRPGLLSAEEPIPQLFPTRRIRWDCLSRVSRTGRNWPCGTCFRVSHNPSDGGSNPPRPIAKCLLIGRFLARGPKVRVGRLVLERPGTSRQLPRTSVRAASAINEMATARASR
jgi:hypothetical protein